MSRMTRERLSGKLKELYGDIWRDEYAHERIVLDDNGLIITLDLSSLGIKGIEVCLSTYCCPKVI